MVYLYIVIGGLFFYLAMSQVWYEIGKIYENKYKSDYQKTLDKMNGRH